MKKLISVLLVLAFFLSAVFVANAQGKSYEVGTYRVAVNKLYVRTGPDKSKPQCGIIEKGFELEVKSIFDEWGMFEYNGEHAFVMLEYLEPCQKTATTELTTTEPNTTEPNTTEPNTTEPSTKAPENYKSGIYRVDCSRLNFRENPSTDSTVVLVLKQGDVLTVTNISNSWGYAVYNGKTGWIALQYTEFISELESPSTNNNLPSTTDTTTETTTELTTEPITEPTTEPTTEPIIYNERTQGRYVITVSKLYLREKPNKDSDSVLILNKNETVEVTRVEGDWGFCYKDGKSGWFMLQYARRIVEYKNCEQMVDIFTIPGREYNVDMQKLKDNGTDVVIIRIGQRADATGDIYADEGFAKLYESAKQAGLKVGAYFYSCAVDINSAAEDAKWVSQVILDGDYIIDYPVFYNIGNSVQKSKPIKLMSAVAAKFCRELEFLSGCEAGLCVDRDMMGVSIDASLVKDYALWLTAVGDYCDYNDRYDIWQSRALTDMSGVNVKVGLSYSLTAFPTKHIYANWTITQLPTCEDYGMEKAKCLNCGNERHRAVLPHGHIEGEWITEKQATNTEDGMMINRCKECGKIIIKKLVEKYDNSSHTHTPASWIDNELKPCGCFEMVLRCSDENCNALLYYEVKGASGHIPSSEKEIKEATCTQNGYERTYCLNCKELIDEVITAVKPHNVKDWTIIKPATHNQAGEKKGLCLDCNAEVIQSIPAAGYALGDVNEDGKLTPKDARLILRFSAKLEEPESPAVRLRADYNADGNITPSDARTVLRISAGLES